VVCWGWGVAVTHSIAVKFLTVSITKRSHNGRLGYPSSETTARRQKP
jgi:hypothetical protein